MKTSKRVGFRLLLVSAMCLAAMGCKSKTATQDSYKIPADAAARKNPLGPDSAVKGKQVYDASDCAVCHGAEGDGQGVVAKQMSVDSHIRNWHDPKSLQDLTDGELYYIIVKGKRRMPGYEGIQTDEQCWEMVSYIRSLAGQPVSGNSGGN